MKWFLNRKLKYINTDVLTEIPPPQPDLRKEQSWKQIVVSIKNMDGNYTCIDERCYKAIPYKELKYTLEQAGYHLCVSGAYRFTNSDYKNGFILYIQKEV